MTTNKLQFEYGQGELFDVHRRHKVLKFVTIVTLFTFVPLGIKNLLIGETVLGISLLTFELSFIIEIVGLIYVQRKIIGYYIPLALLIISIYLSIYNLGMLMSYWVYPIVVTIIFIIPTRAAIIANTLLILSSGIACFQYVDWQVALRFISSLIACAAIAHFAIDAITKLQMELRYLSTRDSLTGALNRHQLDAFMARSLALHQRTANGNDTETTACIAIIDIDHFKQVNDLYGHDVGDSVIQLVVEEINQYTRVLDILFRLGGDEFMLLFDNTNAKDTLRIINNLLNRIRSHDFPCHAKVTLSVGIAQSHTDDDTVSWIKRADIALYQSKQNGRDQVTLVNDINEYPEVYSDGKSRLSPPLNL